jgi:hypothetical protein
MRASRRVGAHDGDGVRDDACGGARGYDDTHVTLTGGGGGTLRGDDGRGQVGGSDTEGSRSNGNSVEVVDRRVTMTEDRSGWSRPWSLNLGQRWTEPAWCSGPG